MKSIRTKIMAGIVCTVTVFLLIVGGVSIYMSYSSSVSQLEDSMKTTAAITASRIEKELEAYRNVAVSFGAAVAAALVGSEADVPPFPSVSPHPEKHVAAIPNAINTAVNFL